MLCFNEELQHTVHLVVSNITFSTQLGGLLPSTTYYICCISASIGNNDVLDEICIQTQVRRPNETIIGNTPTETLEFIRETPISSHVHLMDNRASIVGGVLGFVIYCHSPHCVSNLWKCAIILATIKIILTPQKVE